MQNRGFGQVVRYSFHAAAFLGAICWIASDPRCHGDDPKPVAAKPTFEGLVDQHTRAMFKSVVEYVEQHPQADDALSAFQWIFEVAQVKDYESDVTGLVDRYLERPDASPATSLVAQRVKMLGLAKQGKMDEAMAGLDQQFRGGNLRNPEQTIDFALKLSRQAQLASDFDASRAVLTRLSAAFFLNPYVRTLCENRLAKLELLGEDAPEVSVSDLEEKNLDLGQWAGKVVLVDFWATNCPPCLEEFPALKQIYEDLHAQGLEVAGISLDEDAETVREFQKSWKLPWQLGLSSGDQDRTRRRFRVVTIPSTFLVDRSGKIAYVDLTGKDLRKAIETLLAKKAPNADE